MLVDRPGRASSQECPKLVHGVSMASAVCAIAAALVVLHLSGCSHPNSPAGSFVAGNQLQGLWESIEESNLDASGVPFRSTFEFRDDGTVLVVIGAGSGQSGAFTFSYEVQGDQVNLVAATGETMVYMFESGALVSQEGGGGPERLTRPSSEAP